MKKGLVTIGFMILITIIFISILASMNEITKDRIQKNLSIEKYKKMLYAFDIFPSGFAESDLGLTSSTDNVPWENAELIDSYKSRIITRMLPLSSDDRKLLNNSYLSFEDSVAIYVKVDQDEKNVAYGFPMKGKGLWGTITAFGVITVDKTKMVGIDFTDQVETPGLGARIMEKEFKQYFRNLDLAGFLSNNKNTDPIIMVRKKDQTNLDKSTNSLQAITGATLTCNGVLNMINTDLKFYINLIEKNESKL